MFRTHLLLVFLGAALSACAAHHDPVARLRITDPMIASRAPELRGAMTLGDVAGGAPDVTADGYKKELAYALESSGLLAADAAQARYRVDAAVTLTIEPSIGDRRVTVQVAYHVVPLASGAAGLDPTIEAQRVAPGLSFGAAIGVGVLLGSSAIEQIRRQRLIWAEDVAVRQNVTEFLHMLEGWAAPGSIKANGTIAAASGAVAGSSDDAEFHCPPPGTEIDFISGARAIFEAADRAGCRVRGGATIDAATLFGVYPAEQRDAVQRLWPLKVGKEISFRWTQDYFEWRETYRVVRRENLTVNAGTFDTFVVEWTAKTASPGRDQEVTLWYAPELGSFIKITDADPQAFYPRFVTDEAMDVIYR
jgi:Protein of unknown function (DUF3108)